MYLIPLKLDTKVYHYELFRHLNILLAVEVTGDHCADSNSAPMSKGPISHQPPPLGPMLYPTYAGLCQFFNSKR
jgi:hypothetical protein